MAEQIYNRFDPAKNYEDHRFVPGRGLQSAELNEIQSKAKYDLRQVAEAIFKDGDIVRDAQIFVNQVTGAVRCQSGAIYMAGAVRGVPESELTIPINGTYQIGVRLVEDIITATEDPELLDPATGTRNYNSPGADRTRVTPTWSVGSAEEDDTFFPIYTVIDATVQPKTTPPNLDSITQAIATYDRDSSGGSYIVSGMNVQALPDADENLQVYSISQGNARVYGFPVAFNTSVRKTLEAIPDLKAIFNEPHVSAGTAPQRIDFDRVPGTQIAELTIQARKTVTLTRGASTGGQDTLPDNSVLLIVSVVQGGTTFVAGTDYLLTSGRVNWSPAGNEPAPGSTYQVTYEYLTNVEPTDVDDFGFTVSGAVQGSLVLVTYSQKLPRIDLLCIKPDGSTIWVNGVASDVNPQAPRAPEDALPIASVYQTWLSDRRVRNDGIRLVPMPALAAVDGKFDFLLQLIAQQRLESSIHTREGGTKKGLFTDPFIDDSQRDAGTAQTAAVALGILTLPISATAQYPNADVSAPVALSFNQSVALRQDFRTGSQKFNPYLSFALTPANMRLTPAIDRWTLVESDSLSPITQRFVIGSGNRSRKTSSVRNVLVGVTRTAVETLRPITVQYNISGFGPGEALQAMFFDGIPVAAGTPVANSLGALSGSFTIPEGVPTGDKSVVAIGAGGSEGRAVFSGQGTVERQTFQQQTTITETRWWSPPPPPRPPARRIDPIAQTFTLQETMQIASAEVFFVERPTTGTTVEIRTVSTGFPTTTVLAAQRLEPNEIDVLPDATRFDFDLPLTLIGGQEYALVVLCDDAEGSVAIAELGKFDLNAQRWMTQQPYMVGVMLSSSNAVTWTPHQDRDLTFRLLRADYTQTSRTVDLGSIAIDGATDLILMGYADRPTSQTGVNFRLTLPDGVSVDVEDGQPLTLPAPVTGQLGVSAVLRGNAVASPVLYPGTQIVVGQIATSADYVTRAIPGGANVRVKVIYEAQVPSGSSIVVSYKGPDAGDTWTAIPNPVTRAVDDGFVEFVHEATGVNENSVQIKIELAGTTAARPRVRDLRCIVI